MKHFKVSIIGNFISFGQGVPELEEARRENHSEWEEHLSKGKYVAQAIWGYTV